MSGTSKITTPITIRLKNTTIEKINKAINSPNNNAINVRDYCEQVIERFAWRHDPAWKADAFKAGKYRRKDEKPDNIQIGVIET